jgi:hypothetical protein
MKLKLTPSFSPINFFIYKAKKIKISQPKAINCHLLGDFWLNDFNILTEFKFETRRNYGR